MRLKPSLGRTCPNFLCCSPARTGFPALLTAVMLQILGVGLLTGAMLAPPASAVGVTDTIPVGINPLGIALTPEGTTAYVPNGGSGTVSVIDLTTRTLSTTIPTGGLPFGIAMSPDGSQVIVADFLNGTYDVIRTSDNTIVTTVPRISLCPNPRSLTYHPSGSPIYVGCGDFLRVASIDASTYATSILRLGSNDVDDVAVSQDASELVNAGGGYVIFMNVGWSPGVAGNPAAVTVSTDGDTAYSANDDGTVTSLHYPTTTSHTWSVGLQLSDIVISEEFDRLYVTDIAADRLIVQRLSNRETVASIQVGSAPIAVAVNRAGTHAFVVNNSGNTLSVIDLTEPSYDPQAPGAPLQQFARAESDTCEKQPEDLVDFPALGHVKHTNWGPSWAQWPNEGIGGFVCTRQPYYTSADTWNVR